MSNSNGRIYTETVGGITYGISTDDVSYVLGTTSGDIGTLCVSANIKTFAKFHPLRIGNVAGYTDAQAKSINYGLHVPYYTSIMDMARDIFAGTWTRAVNYNSNKTPFEYDRVKAGDIFRLGDFNGYNHNSEAPYGQIYPAKKTIELWENVKFELPHTTAILGQMAKGDFRAVNSSGTILSENLNLGFLIWANNPVETLNEISYLIKDYSEYNEHFSIYRGYYSSSNIIAVCAFLTNLAQSNTIQTDMTATGYFIPLTFTRALIDGWDFEQPYANYLYDSVMPFNPYGTDDTEFVWSMYPNGNFDFIGTLEANTSGLQPVLLTDEFTVPLIHVNGDNDEPMPVFIKVRTNRANSTAIVKVFYQSYHLGIDYGDVYSETYQGQTLTPDYTETVSMDAYMAGWNIGLYLLQGQLGNSEYGYTPFGAQIPD